MGLNISTLTKAGSGIISGVEKLFSSGKAVDVAKNTGKGGLNVLKSVGKGAMSVGGLAVGAGVSGTKGLLSGLSGGNNGAGNQGSGILSNVLKIGAVFGILKLLSNSGAVKNITDNISALGDKAKQASGSKDVKENSNGKETDGKTPLESKDPQANIATYRSNIDNGAQKSIDNMQNAVVANKELQNQNDKSPAQLAAQQQSQLEM